MKTFDWKFAESEGHRPEWMAWLKENFDKKVSESRFVKAYQKLRATDTRPGKAKRYYTKKVRATYRHLVEKFGFFV